MNFLQPQKARPAHISQRPASPSLPLQGYESWDGGALAHASTQENTPERALENSNENAPLTEVRYILGHISRM